MESTPKEPTLVIPIYNCKISQSTSTKLSRESTLPGPSSPIWNLEPSATLEHHPSVHISTQTVSSQEWEAQAIIGPKVTMEKGLNLSTILWIQLEKKHRIVTVFRDFRSHIHWEEVLDQAWEVC